MFGYKKFGKTGILNWYWNGENLKLDRTDLLDNPTDD